MDIELVEIEYKPPEGGEKITIENGKLKVPDNPIIPMIDGDGVGQDISKTARKVIDSAVEKAYEGKRKIRWLKAYAGDEAITTFYPQLTTSEGKVDNEKVKDIDPEIKQKLYLPEETIKVIDEYLIAIKGPLTTPVGGGIRSLNVTFRQRLDLYACVRPVKWFKGVPAPMRHPEWLDVVIFRENTEDVYAGIEWKEGSDEVKKVISFLKDEMGKRIREDSGIGIKPISITGSKRLVRAAIDYAIQHNRPSVTLVHKGNIMKFTEGAFREWGYDVAKEYGDKVITEEELIEKYDGKRPQGKVVIKDRIADAMFQQLLLRPGEYSVIATTNLNGDYLSDACAAQVGGLGMAPGANINYINGHALFEATHGTAPKYAGQDKVNPSSLILSGCMMLRYMGWSDASKLIEHALEKTIHKKRVTYDLERQIQGAKLLKCSEFGDEIIKNMGLV